MQLFAKLKKKSPIIIGVCGRSCSGKSCAVRALEQECSDVLRIPADRFFKKYNPSELDATNGWESPASIHWDRLVYSLKKLKNGEPTHIPSKGWTENFDQLVQPKKIILVEGYLIFTNPEIVALCDKKIFVDVTDTNILYRRTLRDGHLNGMTYTMEKVIPISKKYEQQQKAVADIVIDGNQTKEDLMGELKKEIHTWKLA